MGIRGPAPTPRHILAARGSSRAKSRKAAKVETGKVIPPVELDADAQWMWDFASNELKKRRILSPKFSPSLYLLAMAWSDYLKSVSVMNESTPFTTTGAGGAKLHPAFRVMMDCWNRVLVGLREFGLSVASIGRLDNVMPDRSAAETAEMEKYFGSSLRFRGGGRSPSPVATGETDPAD